MVIEQSIGAVVKFESFVDEPAQFLLLRNRRGFWGFPQGHKERGESEIQTLLREIHEETGITRLDIQSYIGKIRYSYFKGDGMKSEKEVIFYFATTATKDVTISKEHEEYKWVSLSDALKMLDHAKLKSILSKGHRKGLY